VLVKLIFYLVFHCKISNVKTFARNQVTVGG